MNFIRIYFSTPKELTFRNKKKKNEQILLIFNSNTYILTIHPIQKLPHPYTSEATHISTVISD